MDLDDMLRSLGHFGRFQAFYLTVLLFPVLFSGFRATEYIFTTLIIPHRCNIPECEGAAPVEFSPPWLARAVPLDSKHQPNPCLRYPVRSDINSSLTFCQPESFLKNETESCQKWVFSEPVNTMAHDFNLLCPSEYWKLTTLGSVLVFTSLAARPLVGLISDKLGRKKVLVCGCVTLSITGLLRSFSPNYTVSLMLEAFDGLLTGAVYAPAFVLGLETLSSSKRLLGSMLISMYFALGEVVLAVLAWLVPDWRMMLRIFYTPMLLIAILHWILPESVRWLYVQGRVADVEKIFCRIAKLNGTQIQLPTVLTSLKASQTFDDRSEEKSTCRQPIRSLQLMAVLKSRIMVWRISVTALCSVASSFLYYGISQNATLLASDRYISFILISLIEFPAYVVSVWLPDRPILGRRGTVAVSFLLGAVACFAFLITTPDQTTTNLLLFLVGKFSSTLALTVNEIYMVEVFPTELRNSLYSLCTTIGRLGIIISHQTPLISLYVDPMIVFGVASLLGGVLPLTCPETLGTKLPDTIQEAEDIGRNQKHDKIHK